MAIAGEHRHRGVKAVDVVVHFHSSVRILVMPLFSPLSGLLRFLSRLRLAVTDLRRDRHVPP
jgi:hypothetical protein